MPDVGGTQFSSNAPTLLTAPLVVLAVLFVSVAIGRRILRGMRVAGLAQPSEQFVIGAALGLGVLQFLPFALGALGILSATSVRVGFALLVAAALVDGPALVRAGRRWWIQRNGTRWWERIWFALVALPLVFSFFRALAPSYDPDGIAYHLAAPKRWLELGGLDFLPTLTYTSGAMGTEMLYTLCLPLGGDASAKLLHFTTALLAALGVALIGRRLGGVLVGRFAAVLFLLGPVGIYSVIGFGYAEGTASLGVVACTFSWVIWLQSSRVQWLYVAAVLAGIAVTFKLTSILLPIALACLTVLVVRTRGPASVELRSGALRTASRLAFLVALPVVPWFVRSTIVTGNPVFPLFAQWIPSHDFPAEMARSFESYNRYRLWGSRWGDTLSLDARKAILAAAAVAILGIAAIVRRSQRDSLHRAATVTIALTIVVQLLAAGLYTRYWVPIAAVVQVPLIALVLSRAKARTTLVALFVVTVALAGIHTRSGLRDQPRNLIAASVSEREREIFLARTLPLSALWTAASEEAAPDKTSVLMIELCGAFYIDGAPTCTGVNGSLRVTDWSSFSRDLAKLRITHVVAPTVLVASGTRPHGNGAGSVSVLVAEQTDEMVSRLLRERGQLLITASDWGLYSLAPRDTEASSDPVGS